MVDAAEYVTRLIGQPWQRDGLHCGRLIEMVQRDLFGRSLPGVLAAAPPMTGEGRRERYQIIGGLPGLHTDWRRSLRAVHGCVVLMRRRPTLPDEHIGVWLDLDGGGTLHTDDPHGVVFDSPARLAVRGWIPSWYIPV